VELVEDHRRRLAARVREADGGGDVKVGVVWAGELAPEVPVPGQDFPPVAVEQSKDVRRKLDAPTVR
jgi:hypothetical protein